MAGVTIRNSVRDDVVGILRIYSHEVLHGLATFEEVPPAEDEMAERRASILDLGLPYLVAEQGGHVVGYAYAGRYRTRPAYRYSIENSVYIDRDFRGQGLGRLLLSELIAQSERGSWRQMVAVIGDSQNVGSIRLHEQMGFRHIGTLEKVGFKLGQWVDTVIMQKALCADQAASPDEG
ncbi:GNAT family N-acetyltransferase [Litoreibacter roseus]|uniref:N-acetyltransferase n=1 Tax=Litoreibacter roseus TaxID=2601869 RepID=A0A6N6JKM1_9RHOB|nr:GNAT family N-acetyltransferase [Litoreibacter roseus]GFE65818.1 N-acetyltransferase [Litoreibacter roseus]